MDAGYNSSWSQGTSLSYVYAYTRFVTKLRSRQDIKADLCQPECSDQQDTILE